MIFKASQAGSTQGKVSSLKGRKAYNFFVETLKRKNVVEFFIMSICYFTKVSVVFKFCDSMMFNFLNNLLNISMIFQKVLFDDFHSMLLSSLYINMSIIE